MNHFLLAMESLSRYEGGYVNDPKDPGGETYAGISRKYFPDWEGWKILDTVPGKKTNQKFPALKNLVSEFYYREKWLKNGLEKISDPAVASAVLDTIVQHGQGASLVQKALQREGLPVSVDNRLGPNTITALNKANPKRFLNSLFEVRKAYYEGLVRKDPALSKFLSGWLARISPWKYAGGAMVGLAALIGGAFVFYKYFRHT